MTQPVDRPAMASSNAPDAPVRPERAREAGFRLIVAYKLVKATFGLAFAALLWGLVVTDETARVADIAPHVRHHVTAAWSLKLVDAFASAASRHHIEMLAAALTLDAGFTLFEWYALRTGRPWGSWLVVFATASLLPFEAVAIVRHGSPGRMLLFFVNLAIVVYLARRSLTKHGTPWAEKARGGAV